MIQHIERFTDLNAANLDVWDSLLGPRGFYSASPWMRHAAGSAEHPPQYFIAGEANSFTAGLCGYPLDADTPYVFCSPILFIENQPGYASDPNAPWASQLLPVLACGGRNPSHTKVAGATKCAPKILEALIGEAEQSAWETGCRSISFLNVDEDDVALRLALEQRDFVCLENQVAYRLESPASFEQYLAQFDSKKRVTIQREMRALREAGVNYELRELNSDLIDILLPLELSLYRKHGTAANEHAFRRVFESLVENASDATRVLTASLQGAIVGFVLFFTWNGEFYARQAGFDYKRQGKLPLYFGLTYYELLKLAIHEGISSIYYSSGSDLAKKSRGCTGVRQFAYLKTQNKSLKGKLLALAE